MCTHMTITTNPWERWGKPNKSRPWSHKLPLRMLPGEQTPAQTPRPSPSVQKQPTSPGQLLSQPRLRPDHTPSSAGLKRCTGKGKKGGNTFNMSTMTTTVKLLVNWHSRKRITSISSNWWRSYSTERFNWETPSQANMQIQNINKCKPWLFWNNHQSTAGDGPEDTQRNQLGSRLNSYPRDRRSQSTQSWMSGQQAKLPAARCLEY